MFFGESLQYLVELKLLLNRDPLLKGVFRDTDNSHRIYLNSPELSTYYSNFVVIHTGLQIITPVSIEMLSISWTSAFFLVTHDCMHLLEVNRKSSLAWIIQVVKQSLNFCLFISRIWSTSVQQRNWKCFPWHGLSGGRQRLLLWTPSTVARKIK